MRNIFSNTKARRVLALGALTVIALGLLVVQIATPAGYYLRAPIAHQASNPCAGKPDCFTIHTPEIHEVP